MSDTPLPAFLSKLDDCNFYLLTPLSDVPVRCAAIDVAMTNWRAAARFEPVHRTRILDLNVDESDISEGQWPIKTDARAVQADERFRSGRSRRA